MSRLIGRGCRRAMVTSGRWRRNARRGSSRTWRRACGRNPVRDTSPIYAMVALRSGQKRAARGGPAMDDKGHVSGHLMLITPERVFYAGLLGRPRERCPGAFHVYVAIEGGLRLTAGDGFERQSELVVV